MKVHQSSRAAKTLQSQILSGSVTLLAGSAFAAVLSFAYNISVARLLGPADFGHAAAIYTVLFLFSSITLSFQLVGAKIAAQPGTAEARSAAYRDYHHGAWLFGITAALLLLIFRRGIANYLNVPGPMLVVLIAIGVAFYIPLGSRRGYIQGACSFRQFAGNMVLENAIRLVGAVLLILMGMGVRGVIAANSAAVVIAYFALNPRLKVPGLNPLGLRQAARELLIALAFFSGVAVINNSGIVLVKHYFPDIEAGLYAAVAMVGRVIFALASAIVNSTFPIVAGTGEEERKNPKIVLTSLLLVLGIGCVSAFFLWIAPSSVWSVFLGSGFEIGGDNRLSYLMPLYAIMTTLYALSAVLITYEMAYKVANASWVQLGFSGLVVAAICLFHGSLQEVIYVQTGLMAALLVAVGTPFLINFSRDKNREYAGRPLRRIRPATEDEVIGEFLKNDFDMAIYRDYQGLSKLVNHADYGSKPDNAVRRALFNLRHRPLWKQLPTDTEWHEVEIEQQDLENIRVFPRAQWARLARRDFALKKIVARLRRDAGITDASLQAKIAILRRQMLHGDSDPFGCVLLLAINESGPFTILDGNHRLIAAALDPPFQMGRLRFFCGISPRMIHCCWCKTNFSNLTRYAINRLVVASHDSEAELAELLRTRSGSDTIPDPPAAWLGNHKIESEEDASMTVPHPAISVIKAPDRAGNGKAQRRFLKDAEPLMRINRPRIVLDCSGVRQFDKPFVQLLLCCLEEAMKYNGDVRLAGIPPEARAVLDITGASRLFESFDDIDEAKNSYGRISWTKPKKTEPAGDGAGSSSLPAIPNMTVSDGSVN